MIHALILAAGESRRMGTSKLLLPFGETTIIETVLDHVLETTVESVWVVLGSNSREIEMRIRHLPIRTVFNRRFKAGMLSSIQAGFRALPEETRAALIVLGDQPRIPSAVIKQIIQAYKKSGKGIVLPIYEERRGHPLLIDTKYRKAIDALNPEIGLRQLIRDYPDDLLKVPTNIPAILADIDTPADYKKERGR